MARLECKICLREYKANVEDLTPRILSSCGHTICEGCAVTIFNQNEAGDIACPFDRIVTELEGSVQELHKNFAIIEYLEEIDPNAAAPQVQGIPVVAVNQMHDVENIENILPLVNHFQDNDIFRQFFDPLEFEGADYLAWDPQANGNRFNDEDTSESESDDEELQHRMDFIEAVQNFNIGDYQENYENFDENLL